VFAAGLSHPTALAAGPDGVLYAAEESGVIVRVVAGGSPLPVISGLHIPLGLAWSDQDLYVAVQGGVVRARLQGPRLEAPVAVVRDLPFGEHQQDGLAWGVDGRLYLGSGSTCSACVEKDPRSAAILSMQPDGSDLRTVATGARNPYGLALQPGTGRLYATLNGRDDLDRPGDPEPADSLVIVSQGADFGWPDCWPGARTLALMGSCAGISAPAVYLGPHASADAILFYTGPSFGSQYVGNLFVAEWGQYLTTAGPGHRVARIVLGADGTAPISQVTVFADGIQHPLALSQDDLGGLLVADYGTGQVIRVQADGAP
jgi:glucose/arabinose dehydrogenase